ncbi:LOB domain-containing protein 27, partial [Cucurbita argyrosperma subsp. argyrosperma]
MTMKGGTTQACASCKYQRRRCSKDCPLAPYFPADQPKMFQNAHRLFGVRNIMNILKQVPPSQKDETMTSIIYESNMRSRFPVYGCCGVLWQLHYQIQQVSEELQQVKARVSMMKDLGIADDNDVVFPMIEYRMLNLKKHVTLVRNRPSKMCRNHRLSIYRGPISRTLQLVLV